MEKLSKNELATKAQESITAYFYRMVQIAASIAADESGNADIRSRYEITREFENAVRNNLALIKLDKELREAIKVKLKKIGGDTEWNFELNPYLILAWAIYSGIVRMEKNQENQETQIEIKTLNNEIVSTARINGKIDNVVLRYVAFYAMCIYARRNQPSILENLLNDDKHKDFESFISLRHIELECTNRSDISNQTLCEAKELIEVMDYQPGVIMMYADLVTTYLEGGNENTQNQEEHLKEALRYMNMKKKPYGSANEKEIEELQHYPKAFIIRARVYAALGKYEEALSSVREGIRLQKERRTTRDEVDYMERLSEFYDCRVTIEVAEQIAHLDEVQEKVEKQEKRNVGILGIYTGLVSLIMGAMKVNVEGESSLQTFASFIGLFGCLIIVFSMFYLLLYGKPKMKTADESFIMKAFPLAGVIMVAVALLLLPDRPENLMVVIGVFAVVLGVSFILYRRIKNNSSEDSKNSKAILWWVLIFVGCILIICGNIANATGWDEFITNISDRIQ